ncbi:hypothetical protein N7466_000408 [Penicillium verhagenii]|uniref:uncharacterized protein n=1 Tax=Penicillium verhagenii TaxID=1562060 RepID=UPI0025459F95|nr:uncharacterized protein N7466_000408 [Penicillium verhagenii]KAJ5947393.1 hypothetical protein N7466_000408 [Penicillium verhagenii]
MCSFTLPTELTRSAGLQQQQQLSTGYVHQARNAINADFEAHLSVNRSRLQYNATLGARQSTHGHLISHAGFWACCGCGQMNNEALAPERCSCCSHSRCSNCGRL